jgi:hypothetical protein
VSAARAPSPQPQRFGYRAAAVAVAPRDPAPVRVMTRPAMMAAAAGMVGQEGSPRYDPRPAPQSRPPTPPTRALRAAIAAAPPPAPDRLTATPVMRRGDRRLSGGVSASTRERQLLESIARLDAELWARRAPDTENDAPEEPPSPKLSDARPSGGAGGEGFRWLAGEPIETGPADMPVLAVGRGALAYKRRVRR